MLNVHKPLVAALFLAFAAPAFAQEGGEIIETPQRQLLFVDDFNGSALDRSKWNVEGAKFWVNDEQQVYVDSPDTIQIRHDVAGAEDGALVLKPKWQPGTTVPGVRTADFISGRIDTKGKFDFSYGRAEARIRMTDHVGVWPAFWLLGNGDWPASGEIDIMEYVGEHDWTGSAIHGPGYSGEFGPVNRYYFRDGSDVTDWHVYAVEWTPTALTFLVDGDVAFKETRAMIDFMDRKWAFDSPKFVLLNFALGGAYPVKINNIRKPYPGMPQATVDAIKAGEPRMEVDWVRVWGPRK